jgi:hypothetical protein
MYKVAISRHTATSTDIASGHTHILWWYKQHSDWLSGKESFLKSKHLTSPSYLCVLVGLPVVFTVLNCVTDCYRSQCELFTKYVY